MTGIPNFIEYAPKQYRGGQPDSSGWNALFNLGVSQVIKLNTEEEGSDEPARALGMAVFDEPICTAEQVILGPHEDAIRRAVEVMGPNSFVHCEHGQDRTGLVVGCFRVWKQGLSKHDAWEEMKVRGFHPALLGLTLFFWEEV